MVEGLETAIRNALARSDSSDPAARARIYDSARTAVEKSLQKQASPPDAVAAQRRRVEEVIAAIEAEHAVSAGAGPQATAPDFTAIRAPEIGLSEPVRVDAPTVEPPHEDAAAPAIGGLQARPEDRLGRGSAPAQPVPARPASEAPRKSGGRRFLSRRPEKPARGEDRRRRRRGGGIGSLLTQLLLLFIVIAVALWWISANGGVEQIGRQLADSGVGMLGEEEGSEGLIAPAQRVGAGQFTGNWATVFTAGSAEAVEVGGSATVETVDEGEQPALRIASISGGDPGEVRIPLDAEALASAGSGPVLFALTMRAAGEPTQIYLRCDFASQDGCNRRRFDVNYEITDIVFEADLSSVAGDAALILNSDIAGEGKGIDLFSIRVQPAQ